MVGFLFSALSLGEMVIGFEAFYAAKRIYNSRVVVFGQPCMADLVRHCDFVDSYYPIELKDINEQNCDYLILSNSKTYFIGFAKKSNAKYIICATKIASFFSMRCKSVPIYFFKKYYHLDEREILLGYVRRIDSRIYDSKIDSIEIDRAKIASTPDRDLAVLSKITEQIPPKKALANPYIILVNPFNKACPYSLNQTSWLELAIRVSDLPNCISLIATYPAVHEDFKRQCIESKKDLSKVIIFENDNSVLNLVSLISQVSCVISPSTGTIHLACNQRIQTIAIYPRYDTRRWATHNKQYVFLENPLQSISPNEEEIAIDQTIEILKNMINAGWLNPLPHLQGAVNAKPTTSD